MTVVKSNDVSIVACCNAKSQFRRMHAQGQATPFIVSPHAVMNKLSISINM